MRQPSKPPHLRRGKPRRSSPPYARFGCGAVNRAVAERAHEGGGEEHEDDRPILIRDWRTMAAALAAARETGRAPILVTPENAAATYGAGYLAALEERGRTEFPDIAFTLIVDCGDTPGFALACLRAGVRRISMREPNDKIADIARQMGAELVRRPT